MAESFPFCIRCKCTVKRKSTQICLFILDMNLRATIVFMVEYTQVAQDVPFIQ